MRRGPDSRLAKPNGDRGISLRRNSQQTSIQKNPQAQAFRRLAQAKRLSASAPHCPCNAAVLGRPGGYGEGFNTRSHPELGRENPQRRWYCVLRRGRVGRRQVFQAQPETHHKKLRSSRAGITNPRPPPDRQQIPIPNNAGWSSPVARQAHNLKVAGSNPAPATNQSPLVQPGGFVDF